ncbi:uncharacterized protein L969DRAFT_92648 [Mixia osmundae IAM 14324]|uniref:Methyltransferase domain-containing protein n=1 Tax=Mixia osmundae (strain CBS 9802 / IAM 14324 / JCM 22182 / KY 12970) TaxID=764103 RepID=G7DY56_MIXOS|nr:uncharacterized protein L969DRAFT_92648 [Mixia osmundae IAM 14324]KEI41418.1 hypothetical protein L969DRAFT_92648 [Mixia osmundae IAM 14324]GAA95516.1 hypothetical protein E5Q_02171 [Mixia osmundae IAM 14324]
MTLEVVPEPSKLGTKSHWDEVYAREVDNYRAAGDEGECWFGLDAASDMVEWAQEHVPPEKKPKVLDLGCGNGHLLFSLAQEGDYDTSLMTGVDYAPASIELSRAIATQRGIAGITWKVVDIFEQTSASAESYDLALDKGTFDAISLAPTRQTRWHLSAHVVQLDERRAAQ